MGNAFVFYYIDYRVGTRQASRYQPTYTKSMSLKHFKLNINAC